MKDVFDVIAMPPLTPEDRARFDTFRDDLVSFGTAILFVGEDGSFHNFHNIALGEFHDLQQADRPSEGPGRSEPAGDSVRPE